MFTLKDKIPDHTLIMIIIVVPIIITLFTAGLLLIYIYIFFSLTTVELPAFVVVTM